LCGELPIHIRNLQKDLSERSKGEEMKLSERICDLKLAYLLKREPAIAFELALLYYIRAKRKSAEKKIEDNRARSVYWLRLAGIKVRSEIGQLDEIERMLVSNKECVGARLSRCFGRGFGLALN
jgi:hypothetical protein